MANSTAWSAGTCQTSVGSEGGSRRSAIPLRNLSHNTALMDLNLMVASGIETRIGSACRPELLSDLFFASDDLFLVSVLYPESHSGLGRGLLSFV